MILFTFNLIWILLFVGEHNLRMRLLRFFLWLVLLGNTLNVLAQGILWTVRSDWLGLIDDAVLLGNTNSILTNIQKGLVGLSSTKLYLPVSIEELFWIFEHRYVLLKRLSLSLLSYSWKIMFFFTVKGDHEVGQRASISHKWHNIFTTNVYAIAAYHQWWSIAIIFVLYVPIFDFAFPSVMLNLIVIIWNRVTQSLTVHLLLSTEQFTVTPSHFRKRKPIRLRRYLSGTLVIWKDFVLKLWCDLVHDFELLIFL